MEEKMGLFISKFFWGTLLIVWGVIMIIDKLFKLNIPYGRFIFAFILIYAGIYLIAKTSSPKKTVIEKNAIRSETITDHSNFREYNMTFGENVIDLTTHIDYSKEVKINTVFGVTDVYLSEKETYDIKVSTVFGETSLPMDKTVNFGSNHYVIGNDSNQNKINVEINTVFGNTKVMMKAEN